MSSDSHMHAFPYVPPDGAHELKVLLVEVVQMKGEDADCVIVVKAFAKNRWSGDVGNRTASWGLMGSKGTWA